MKNSIQKDNPSALIVDDEADIRELLEITLNRMGVDTTLAQNMTEAKQLIDEHHFDVCLTDMRLPDGDGLEIVAYIQNNQPLLPVAVITAHGNMDLAITALKEGAFDFVSKPVKLDKLKELVQSALKLKERDKIDISSDEEGFEDFIGQSAAIQKLQKQIHKLARSQAPVHIFGESGSGKELVARMIHEKGPRKDKPFVAVNCGAIPSELMESEFFGHKKGSFTGAIDNKVGLFEAASGGTLFLDEVADLPMHMQVKLLRAIQEQKIRPVGSQTEEAVDCRILSATHKDIEKQVELGHFRQDLYFRINVIEAYVPPLRDRPEDIPLLAQGIIDRIAGNWEIEAPNLGKDAHKALQQYHFPGNVRELENILERSITLCDDDVISAEDLQLKEKSSESYETNNIQEIGGYILGTNLEEYLQEVEKTAILSALDATRWNRTAAAKKLGMSFRSLRYRLKKLALDNED